jgi:hypothetical protein
MIGASGVLPTRRSALVLGALGLLALGLVSSPVSAGSPPEPLSIGLSPTTGKAGTTVSVTVADDACAGGTTGVFKVNAGAPDDPVLATVEFSDPNQGSFTAPELAEDVAGAPTAVVVECLDEGENERSGEASWGYEMLFNQFTFTKQVENGSSPQVFRFALEGTPEPISFALSDGGTEPDNWVIAGESAQGQYKVTEQPTDGWELKSIDCDDTTAAVDLANRSVTFTNTNPDYKINCTFLNAEVAPSAPAAPASAEAALAISG